MTLNPLRKEKKMYVVKMEDLNLLKEVFESLEAAEMRLILACSPIYKIGSFYVNKDCQMIRIVKEEEENS